jgi:hypothetical protein
MHRSNKTIASNYIARQQQAGQTSYGSPSNGNYSNSLVTEINSGMPADYINNCQVDPGACGCVVSPPKPCTIHDNEGLFQWAQNVFPDSADNIPETVRPFSVTTDRFGNIYYAGMYNSQNDIPLRNAGTQGTGNVNSGIILPSSFIYYPDPDYYVAIFAPFLIKLDPNGVVQWAFRVYQSYVVPGTDYLSLNGVVTDSQGNVYISGQYLTVNTNNPNPPNTPYDSALSCDLSNGSVSPQYKIPVANIPIYAQPSMYLIKVNANGTYLGSKAYGATNKVSYYNAITIDSNDNIYIAGSHNETVEVNGQTRTPKIPTSTDYRSVIYGLSTALTALGPSFESITITKNKINTSIPKDKIFIQPFPKLSYNTGGDKIVNAEYKIDILANILSGINTQLKQQVQYTTPFIISLLKYPSSLASVLEQNFNNVSGDAYANGVYTDNTNVYITGGYRAISGVGVNPTSIGALYPSDAPITLPPTNPIGTTYFTTFLAKYNNSNLSGVWATYIYNNNNIFGFSIGGDSLKNIYLVGQYDNSQTDLYNASSTGFYTASGTKLPTGGIGGVYVVKYNSAGVVQWQIPFGYGLNGITTDVYNNFYVIGIYGNPRIYNSATGTTVNTQVGALPTPTTGPATAVIKYDSSGVLQWYMGFNYITASLGFGVTQNSLNCASNVYICGSYVNNINETMKNATPPGTQSIVNIAGPTPNTSNINRDSSYVFKLF